MNLEAKSNCFQKLVEEHFHEFDELCSGGFVVLTETKTMSLDEKSFPSITRCDMSNLSGLSTIELVVKFDCAPWIEPPSLTTTKTSTK